MSRAKDERSLYEKMSDVATGRGTAPAEREMAKRWMEAHPDQKPMRTAPPMGAGYTPQYEDLRRRSATRQARPMSDEEKRRRDQREEAAHRREQEQRFAREHRADPFEDFDDVFRQAFYEGFEEEMARGTYGARPQGFYSGASADPYNHARSTPETEKIRREERNAAEREARESMREARAQARNERDREKDAARTAKAQAKAAEDRMRWAPGATDPRPTSRFGEFSYRIEQDENGNPVRRRT